ncbi:alpha/beta hydrolase [bacterium (Candidatus Blackallbacteria) CG17_big_fil_post_rev_8_21_14_2_50_48_46]|uniref:Alpha/beta hydrolase n=1 Tax=bacterium (Candidatus Blackallbacteria) CG17_big_fil_post_rev_8_21_14_2_50_48_46 TaxID=2014261 RepID=A0A2M7FX79_9BACT|nr:MAG: alpha/beta hydrolase [bacterium (Candidatus Blackallbacteria) CG18_big_fil_WC_8_21_14_2_50_49_26]PIW13867.1 MAG: alpha/beta hydrolase [bacterium (Candidatus Blackallbacteria) CG17_big_fil_post_rev_8_21_14_2_50_48_46]PIW45093.1 MAG: alpha/beta hydrolase [bacterium (Candidatus Blackallbacteria) CG13_big_fil_rev_8_21_14_2_50_49_14]
MQEYAFTPENIVNWLLAPEIPAQVKIPRIICEGRRLDPRAWLLGELIRLGNLPEQTIFLMRERYQAGAALFEDPPTEINTEDLNCLSPNTSIPLRLYRPNTSQESLPCILYFHGGGMVIGSIETHDGLCRRLCKGTEAAVLSVDYRLAPENPFPAALEDAQSVWHWLQSQATENKLLPHKIAVAGDSAGGNIAASLLQDLLISGQASPCAQVLLYPWIDMGFDWPSMKSMAEAPVLSTQDVHWFQEHYLPAWANPQAPRLSPLQSSGRAQEPPAFVLTCGFDPLRDMGKAYAESRRQENIEVFYHEAQGQIHAFLQSPRVLPEAREVMRMLCQWLKMQFSQD